MPRFHPFPALRYAPGVPLGDVASPPYDVIDPEARRELEDRHPNNSVRLDFPRDEDGNDAYQLARARLDLWAMSGVLRLDAAPAFTIYRMTPPGEGARSTTGVIGALGIEPPGTGDVLPHEETTPKDKADRLSLIRACEANLSPIWGLSLAPGLSAHLTPDGPPSASCVDNDGVRHEVWVIDGPEAVTAIAATVASAPVVIADGHHRYETASVYAAERRSAAAAPGSPTGPVTGPAAFDSIMSFVVELTEDQLDVRPIHRMISGIDGTQLAVRLSAWFESTPLLVDPGKGVNELAALGGLALVTSEGSMLLKPRRGVFGPEVEFDSQRVAVALATMPGVGVAYHHDATTVVRAARGNLIGAGILLRPATVPQISAVAASRARTPPKTTFFWPKPRTGLLFRRFSDDRAPSAAAG